MNILVIRFSSLGDLITQDIAYRAIRYFYKDSKITFLTSKTGESLYSGSSHFDSYVALESNYFETVSTLKEHKFNIIFDLQCNSKSYFLTFFLRHKLALNQSAKWWQKLLRIKVKTKWFPELLYLSGIDIEKINEYSKIKENFIIQLPHAKKSYNWQNDNKKTIAIAIGASERWESKKWGDKYYSNLVGKLTENHYNIVLIGSQVEEKSGCEIERDNPNIVNLINKTTLSELKSVLASVDLLIGNDSGPAHLAAGVGISTLTIFGSTDIKHCVCFGGYLGNHSYLVAEPQLICQPCYKSKCPTQHECMKAISVEQVYSTVIDILEG